MERSTFIYDDGTWGIKKGTYVEVNNYYDDPLRNWSEVDYLELTPQNSTTLKIPKTHIVEIDFITRDTLQKKSKLLRGLVGFAAASGLLIGFGATVSLSPLGLLMSAGIVNIGKVTISGGVIGALTGFSKSKKENYCIISYLNENEPNDLKIIILDANATIGNSFVKDRQKFVKELQTQVRRITKADCVKALMLEIDKELEKQENELKKQDDQRKAMIENSAHEIDGFIFRAEDIFTVAGRGTVVTGKVAAGSISVNDEIYIVKPSGMVQKCYVAAIERYRREIQTAKKDDNVGILLNLTGVHTLERGDILCTSDVIDTCKLIALGITSFQHVMESYSNSFYADVRVFNELTGGNEPLLEGKEYTFSFGNKVYKGTMRFPADKASKLLPEDEDAVIVKLFNPIFIRKDFEFIISSGDTLKAKGVISEICHD